MNKQYFFHVVKKISSSAKRISLEDSSKKLRDIKISLSQIKNLVYSLKSSNSLDDNQVKLYDNYINSISQKIILKESIIFRKNR